MSREVFLRMQVAEAKGQIPDGMAAGLTYATVVEAGLKAAYDGYYGKGLMDKALEDVSKAKLEQQAMDIADSIVSEAGQPLMKILKDTHTTSDFPIALAQARRRILRGADIGEQMSNWRGFANVITVPDFKNIRAIRLTELPELKLRPEGTDVQFTSWGESEEGYRIANYERGIPYTWEMWLNDEIGMFQRALASLGRGARRTEIVTVLSAIASGLSQHTPTTAGVGGPTIDRVKEVRQTLAAETFQDEDGNAIEYGWTITDVIFGTFWQDDVNVTLNQQFTDFQGGTPNPVRNGFTPHLERMWNRVLGKDWIAYDRMQEWLEVAFLRGFEGGPKTYTKIPDVREQPNEGSFANHSLAVKMGHTFGAKVLETTGIRRVKGV